MLLLGRLRCAASRKDGAVSIEITEPATVPNLDLLISVSGNAVKVQIASDGAGNATSTAKNISDAVNDHIEASVIMSSYYGGDGSGVVSTSLEKTVLEPTVSHGDGNAEVLFTICPIVEAMWNE